MIISAKLIKQRKNRICPICDMDMDSGQNVLKLFGMAERRDPPYNLYICITCAVLRAKNNKKIKEAFEVEK